MNSKNIITWKDADQNFCTLATGLLLQARQLITPNDQGTYATQTTGGKIIAPGYLDADGSKRTIFSCHEITITEEIHHDRSTQENNYLTHSPLCWYSFQNMVRIRIIEARQEIMRNLYTRANKPKTSQQSSRNPNGRSGLSKFLRQKERTEGPTT